MGVDQTNGDNRDRITIRREPDEKRMRSVPRVCHKREKPRSEDRGFFVER
jgi:hypothetical protein